MERFKYGIKEYFKPTPARIKRFLLMLKGITASAAVVAYADSGWQGACIVGVVGFLIAESLEFVGEHPELFAVEQAKQAIKDTVEEAAEEVKQDKLNEDEAESV